VPTLPSASLDLLAILDAQLGDLVGQTRSAVVSIHGQVDLPPPLPPPFPSRGNADVVPPIATHLPVTGSGFLLPGGVVVTTAEVVNGVTDPYVVLVDGRRIKATGINSDPRANIAILRITGVDTTLGLRWGDSQNVRAGNLAITIGNQSGFAGSAALGLIASVGQQARSADNSRHYDNLIQFQGALGAGGSGSPLINTRGEVIGIVIGIVVGPQSQSVANYRPHPPGQDRPGAADGGRPSAMPVSQTLIFGGSNMGFALPADRVRVEVEALVQGVKSLPAEGWLGIQADRAEGGLLITSIYVGSPADHAGVQPGDLLVTVNGQAMHSSRDLRRATDLLIEGQDLTVQIRRNDKTQELHLHILAKPEQESIDRTPRRSLTPHVGWSPANSSTSLQAS
jgi:S1-C subfamily serine protease